jgi:cytochrome c553
MHANKSTLHDRLLWPRDLTSPVTPENPANRYCTACHRADGPAKPPAVAVHPEIVMKAVASLSVGESLPLYDDQGRISADGRIACATCHLPHGQTLNGNEADRLAAGSGQQRLAARLLLRPFNAPNLCTTCHGADGLRRFLYFHDPLRRSGPLSNPQASIDRSGAINVRLAP